MIYGPLNHLTFTRKFPNRLVLTSHSVKGHSNYDFETVLNGNLPVDYINIFYSTKHVAVILKKYRYNCSATIPNIMLRVLCSDRVDITLVHYD